MYRNGIRFSVWVIVGTALVLAGGGAAGAFTNADFEGSFSSGVASGWNAWTSQGSGAQYKASGTVGRIGGGIYGNLNNPPVSVQAMNGKTCLLMDSGLDYLPTLRANMPDTIFVGRLFIDHLTVTYLSDPEYYGRQFADVCASKPNQPDVWMGMNEIGASNGDMFKLVARFETAFTERLHEHGMQSCVLGLAVGNPGNMSYMEFDEVRDCLAIADYVGYHSYGSQSEQLMGGVNQQGSDYPWYALRWRMYRDTYDSNGWRMPPVIYTEATTWAGWKNVFSAQQILDDLEWMSVQMLSDPWSLGMCIFVTGGNGDPQWMGWECANEPTIYNGAGTHNAQFPTDAKSGKAQIFGNSTSVWKGGINQAVSTTSGRDYRFRIHYKWEYFAGVEPEVTLRLGYDPTGQTSNGSAGTIQWSGNLNAGVQAIHQTWRTAEATFEASSSSGSFWIEGYQDQSAPRWRLCVDDASLTDITGGPTATPTPTSAPTHTPTPSPTPAAGSCTDYDWDSYSDPSEVDSIVESSGGWGGSQTASFQAGENVSGHLALRATQDYGASYWVWNFTGLTPNAAVTVSMDVNVNCSNNSSWFEVFWSGGTKTASQGKGAMGSHKAKWDSNGGGNGVSSSGWTTIGDSAATADGNGNFTVAIEYGHWSASPSTVSAYVDNLEVCPASGGGPTPTPTPTPTATPTPSGLNITENFEFMPSWSDSFDGSWGSAASWLIQGGGQSGNSLQAARGSQGSSVKTLVYTVPTSTTLDIGAYLRCPNFGGGYWMEFAYRLGSHSASNFDNNAGAWTMVKKFDSYGGQNGNSNTWTHYSTSVNTGSNTQITVGFKLGSSGGGGPTVGWDTMTLTD